MKNILRVAQEIIIILLNILGTYGLTLILYGALSHFYPSTTWPLLERIAQWVPTIVTPLSTLLIAISIYIPTNTRKPDFHSTHITAPAVIGLVILAFVYMIYCRIALPINILNGFAILGLSGALFRLLRFSERSQ